MSDPLAMNLPGSPSIPRATQHALDQALAAKGPSYVPRTHHVQGRSPKYTNRLILSTSPYLLQHAHNPVNWFPWGDEAFDVARTERKPVFLSIGYSTCHWCHVMERESFEDEDIAAFLNTHYVCIKVDREERPDVDAVYMTAVQNINGSGGWPMSVWLTAERLPFFAGTYFPPRDGVRGAGRGFLSLLRDLSDVFHKTPSDISKAAQTLVDAVKADMEGGQGDANAAIPPVDVVAQTVAMYQGAFDRTNGGLRRAPKFPSHLPVRLLLRHHLRTGDANALHMATLTLEKMAAGGMYDQIGGGFHRYSTDAQWLVPHFEKMLYDNALLVRSYTEGYAVTKRPAFARVARETLEYVLREMTDDEGGFYSATDADSEAEDGEHEEGRFFVFSLDEIIELLGDEAADFARHYGVTAQGNFEGANILHVKTPDEEAWLRFTDARKKLYAARARRIPPARDDKILAAWNGLMISAFAVAGRVLNEPRYVQAASRAADFVLTNLTKADRILRSYKDGRAQAEGFLDDQAFVTAALLDLFEATAEPRWLRRATDVAAATQRDFADSAGCGWFMVALDGEDLLARERPTYDGAEPSGTSVALMNALRLAVFTDDDTWRVVAERALASLRTTILQRPMNFTEGLLALDRYWDDAREVVIVWPPGQRAEAEPLLQVLRETLVPAHALVATEEGAALAAVAQAVPFAAGKACIDNQPTAFVCARGRCDRPTTLPDVLRAQLATGAAAARAPV